MLGPLVETKLYPPMWRAGLVARPRLLEQLDHGARSKLVLVSAPAGFGKTTLLAEWLTLTRAASRSVAWISLDDADNHGASFWAYLIAALQTARPGVEGQPQGLLQRSDAPAIETLLPALLNQLGTTADELYVVLDDYHSITNRAIHDGIAFMLKHLPLQVHLVITSRADPPFALARMRARGELTEVRAADLRFTPDEAATFLNQTMGLSLSAHDVGALEAQTEGWIAGLQLAAISMQGRDDPSGFIAGFAGDDRYIVDYLVEEVLRRQPEDVREFLLQTSLLDRLSGPLCDAVTGQAGGRARLEALERANLFVVSLDDRRHWYRYHHLFADVLRAHLLDEHPAEVRELHRRAAEWYEENGERPRAVRHALAAADYSRAADLVELASPEMRRTRQDALLLAWLKALPDEVVACRPVLNGIYAHSLLTVGEFRDVEDRLRDAERLLAMIPGPAATGIVVKDSDAFSRLPGQIAVGRAGLALFMGDLPGAESYARRVLNLVPADDHIALGAALAILGLASWAAGDLDEAYRSYAAGMVHLHEAGNIADTVVGTVTLANIRLAQGRLRDATHTYQEALRLAVERGEPVVRGTADMHVGLAETHLARNDLEAAAQHLLAAQELGEHAGGPQNRYRLRVARALLLHTHGDTAGALDLLREAEHLFDSDFSPNVRPIPALRTRLWIADGRLDDALDWAHEHDLSVADDLSYVREFEHITLARLLLVRHKVARVAASLDEAMVLLDRLLRAAECGGRGASVIEILVLQSLAFGMRDGFAAARAPLERALSLAEPEGYVRLFVDEGKPMRNLLRDATAPGARGAYTERILRAVEDDGPATSAQQVVAAGLAGPLTPREIEILRLLAKGMRNQDIAEHLVISPATVKRHIANAYIKLDVSHRTEALVKARTLNLL